MISCHLIYSVDTDCSQEVDGLQKKKSLLWQKLFTHGSPFFVVNFFFIVFAAYNKFSFRSFKQAAHLLLDHLFVNSGRCFDIHSLQSKPGHGPWQCLAPAFITIATLTDMPGGVEPRVSKMPCFWPAGPISPTKTPTSLLQHAYMSCHSPHYQWEAGIHESLT